MRLAVCLTPTILTVSRSMPKMNAKIAMSSINILSKACFLKNHCFGITQIHLICIVLSLEARQFRRLFLWTVDMHGQWVYDSNVWCQRHNNTNTGNQINGDRETQDTRKCVIFTLEMIGVRNNYRLSLAHLMIVIYSDFYGDDVFAFTVQQLISSLISFHVHTQMRWVSFETANKK